MTTKQDILNYVTEVARQKLVTRSELVAAYDQGAGVVDGSFTKKVGISEILYYVGGGIVCMGIAILIGQNWETLGVASRILVTLGSGIAAYVVGAVLLRDKKTEAVAHAFHLISAVVLPTGLGVVAHESGVDVGEASVQTIIGATVLAVQLGSYYFFRRNIFLLFSILFGTWLFYAVTDAIIGGRPLLDDWDFDLYRTLVVAMSYMALGYAFDKTEREPLTGFLYFFGSFEFLLAAIFLGGWEPDQNLFWEIIYPFLAFGMLFASIPLRSKSFLVWGTIFLMAFILKITGEYFATGFGWPTALVIAGLALIGIGAASLRFKHRYFDQPVAQV